MAESLCVSLGGVYLGNGTTCVGINCAEVGACCPIGGACYMTTAAPCLAAGHLWQGAGTSCLFIECPPAGEGMISRGVGDTVAKGIKMATFGMVKPCTGCKSRIAWLNRKFPYRRRR